MCPLVWMTADVFYNLIESLVLVIKKKDIFVQK